MPYDYRIFSHPVKKAIKWSNVRLMIFDCDGVLTDGKIIYGGEMMEIKHFNAHDGMGFMLLRTANLVPAVITGRSSKALARRCEDLGITHLYQGVSNKLAVAKELLDDLGLSFSQAVYVGDDWNDIPVMLQAGFSFCPADAMPEIQQISDYIAHRKGGEGAARECIDFVLQSMGIYEKTVIQFLDEIS